ncbi:MAG: hypothetical protein AB7S70_11675 [Hyphomicrobium sp.]|uniref:hypothetical protein n=1 Tax=Hyphomicrobium sp. TaxID=82 RepID=UPI003D127116
MPRASNSAARSRRAKGTQTAKGAPNATASVAPAPKKSAGALRNLPLDFVKGALVVVMVVYHALNILSDAGPEAYTYLRFVSGAFILVSGYVIASFFERPFKADPAGTSRKLISRGLKLLLLFTLLNVLIHLTGFGNPNKGPTGIDRFLGSLLEVYVQGAPGAASFQILLPIAYLLILAPLVLALAEAGVWVLAAAIAAALIEPMLGGSSANATFMVLGVIGLSGGLLLSTARPLAQVRNGWVALAGLVAVTALAPLTNDNLVTYALQTSLLLKLLYDIAQSTDLGSQLPRALILLGRTSLVCYILQIIFLQVLNRAFLGVKWPLGGELALAALATVLVMWVAAATLDRLRASYTWIDRMYKLVFG